MNRAPSAAEIERRGAEGAGAIRGAEVASAGRRGSRVVTGILAFAITALLVAVLDFVASIAWPSPLSGDLVQLRPRLTPSLRQLLAPGQVLDELAFRFVPNERTRMVRVVFGLDHELVDDDLAVLSLSAIPELPSRIAWVESGSVVRSEVLPGLHADPVASSFRIRIHDGLLDVEQDGRLVTSVAFVQPQGPVHVGLYPSYPMAYLRADFHRLEAFALHWHDGDGAHERRAWCPWRVSVVRPVVLILVALAALRRLARWPGLRRAVTATAATVLALVLLAIPLGPRWCPSGDEQAPYEVDGRFDAARFAAEKGLDSPPSQQSLTLVAFGGSTTAGDPFDSGEGFDYPARLERRLARSPVFANRTTRVMNAAKVGISLASIDEILAPIVGAVRPNAVLLSSVYNNLFDFDVRVAGGERIVLDTSVLTLFAQIFGRPSAELRITPASVQLYETGLRCFAGVAAANQVASLWIEEPIDSYYFHGANPSAAFQESLRRVAAEMQVPVVRLQQAADDDPDRLRFYEYIHLTALGYDWVAESLATWLEAHPELLAPRPEPAPSLVTAEQVPACAELARLRR